MSAVGILAAGKLVTIPGVITEIDASAMTPVSPQGAKIPLFIGSSDGGDPSKVYRFTSFDDAKTLIRSGAILSYISRAFAPSPDLPGASEVRFIRASSTAAKAVLTMTPLVVSSLDFGFWTNGIRLSIVQDATGDVALPLSYGPTVNFKPWTLNVKNLASKQSYSYYLRSGLTLISGAGLSVNVNFTTNTFQLLNGATVLDEVPFTSAPTLKDLAVWINGHTGWTATVIGASWYPVTVLNSGTTAIGAQAIFISAEAGLAAFLLNSQNPLVSAALPGVPGALAAQAETSLAGGAGRSSDVIDANALTPALTLAATTTAHALFIQSAASAMQQLALTHCLTMNQPDFQKFRIFFAGMNFTGTSNVDGADGTASTDVAAAAAAVLRAQSLDGPCVLGFNGSTAPNPLTGLPEQLGGLGVAAQAIGAWAGGRTKDPLTNKAFISQGLEFPNLSKTTKEALLDGGVFSLWFDADTGRTRCLQAITTYQTTNPQFRNLQGLTIQHVIERMWLRVLSGYVGGTLSLEEGERVKTDCAKALDGVIYTGNNPDGFLTEGRKADGTRIPSWESLTVSGDSTLGMWSINVNAHPVGETDYIRVRTKLTPVPIEL